MRNTQSGRIIRELLQHASQPMSLAELFERAKQLSPTLAFSTVTRTIARLESTSEVTRIDWRERGSHFEWAADPHHHIVCRICNTVRDLNDSELGFDSRLVEQRTGFSINRHSIELVGLCQRCQRSNN